MARTRPKERPREGGSRLAAAAALLLLIVVGFAVGMLAGLAWEEPGLILAHFTGQTEEVAWSAGAPEGQATRAAEAPPRDDRPADPQIRRKEERAVAPETPAVAAAPVGRLAVQVGAFETSRAAEHLATSLRDKGFPVYVSPGATATKARWRVRVGPLTTREEAESTAARLKKVEKLPTWILSEDAT
jgi:cell division septation protein DedD